MRIYFWLVAAFCFLPAPFVQGATITFDLDTGIPGLVDGLTLPLVQTSSGMTAQFRPTAGLDGFSVQSDSSTGFTMPQFSGHYLNPNGINPGPLDIAFSQLLNSIALTFATADFQQVEIPTTILLTAYVDSTGTPPVGTATAHGTYGASTMPMGTIAFTSSQPFNLVEIKIQPGQPLGSSDFLVDNVETNTAAPAPGVPEPTGYTLMTIGLLGLGLVFRKGRTAE